MTAPDILKVVTTVAITQLVVDLMSRYVVFSRDPYKRAVASLERAQSRRDKLAVSLDTPQKQEKQAKKLQRYQEDCSDAASEVARRHTVPGFCGSVIFLILYRVLSTEYAGKVIGVIPFTPFKLMRKLTLRGLEISSVDPKGEHNVYQACSFLLIYILCTLSVKYFVHKLVGVAPPKEAEGGLSTVMDAPKNQKMLKSFGVNPDILKTS
jgi:uncharacterized membrane protein (DUF106 family)